MSQVTLGDASKLIFALSLLGQIFLVFLYFRANRKRRHASFVMLVIGNLFYVAYFVLGTISWFVEMSDQLAADLYRIGVYCAFPALVLVLAGAASLTRAYLALAPAPDPPSPRPTGNGGSS